MSLYFLSHLASPFPPGEFEPGASLPAEDAAAGGRVPRVHRRRRRAGRARSRPPHQVRATVTHHHQK